MVMENYPKPTKEQLENYTCSTKQDQNGTYITICNYYYGHSHHN